MARPLDMFVLPKTEKEILSRDLRKSLLLFLKEKRKENSKVELLKTYLDFALESALKLLQNIHSKGIVFKDPREYYLSIADDIDLDSEIKTFLNNRTKIDMLNTWKTAGLIYLLAKRESVTLYTEETPVNEPSEPKEN